mmetsp:Transcript_96911/g.273933  ORF Transcript_96911/g.273933 Transcript_96911/m.273933 type:complete len:268 (+) Transcript_96911:484-1287(+)
MSSTKWSLRWAQLYRRLGVVFAARLATLAEAKQTVQRAERWSTTSSSRQASLWAPMYRHRNAVLASRLAMLAETKRSAQRARWWNRKRTSQAAVQKQQQAALTQPGRPDTIETAVGAPCTALRPRWTPPLSERRPTLSHRDYNHCNCSIPGGQPHRPRSENGFGRDPPCVVAASGVLRWNCSWPEPGRRNVPRRVPKATFLQTGPPEHFSVRRLRWPLEAQQSKKKQQWGKSWRRGLLAKRMVQAKTSYRLVPQSPWLQSAQARALA